MDFYSGTFLYLSAKALMTAALGSPLKLFPDLAPQNAQLPYVIYTCPNIDRTIHINGASAMADYHILFDIYAETSESRFRVGEALRNILHSRQNIVLTDSNNNTVRLEWCELNRDHLGIKPQSDGTEQGVFARMMDFRIVINEPIPTLP